MLLDKFGEQSLFEESLIQIEYLSGTIFFQVDVAKQAYHQAEALDCEQEEEEFEEEDGEDEEKTNPRDVGHNIYILAHQVKLHLAKNINNKPFCFLASILKKTSKHFIILRLTWIRGHFLEKSLSVQTDLSSQYM